MLLDPGDEVIIPAPYWVSYAELVKLAGGIPKIVATEQANDFKLTPTQLRASIGPRDEGAVDLFPFESDRQHVLARRVGGLGGRRPGKEISTVIADEIYERLVYGSHRFASFATVRPGLADRTLTINGVSKAYAMTGWRIGWTLAPEHRQGHRQPAEPGNVEPVERQPVCRAGGREWPARLRGRNARAVRRAARSFAGGSPACARVSCPEMGGAFYAFMNIRAHLGRKYNGVDVKTSSQWCLELLAQQGVATVQGSAFGAEGYARLSFAASMANLEAGFDRIEAFLKSPQ